MFKRFCQNTCAGQSSLHLFVAGTCRQPPADDDSEVCWPVWFFLLKSTMDRILYLALRGLMERKLEHRQRMCAALIVFWKAFRIVHRDSRVCEVFWDFWCLIGIQTSLALSDVAVRSLTSLLSSLWSKTGLAIWIEFLALLSCLYYFYNFIPVFCNVH